MESELRGRPGRLQPLPEPDEQRQLHETQRQLRSSPRTTRIDGLAGGITYYYVLTAVDTGENESGFSNEAAATPYDSVPAIPSNPAATPAFRSVFLGWDTNSEADLQGYNVYRSTTSGTGYAKVNGSPVTSGTQYSDTGLDQRRRILLRPHRDRPRRQRKRLF
jgi:hypothetical protein